VDIKRARAQRPDFEQDEGFGLFSGKPALSAGS
jgi:hypothetical protein